MHKIMHMYAQYPFKTCSTKLEMNFKKYTNLCESVIIQATNEQKLFKTCPSLKMFDPATKKVSNFVLTYSETLLDVAKIGVLGC